MAPPARPLVLAALAGLLMAPTPDAHARRGPNPDGRTGFPRLPGIESATAATPAAGTAAPAQEAAAASVLVPLPAGAIQLDSTYYDLQDLGSLATRVAIGADGRVHVTWQDDHCDVSPNGCPPNLSAPVPHPVRGMGYAVRDALGAWSRRGRVGDTRIRCSQCVPDLMGGLGGLALSPAGRVAIAEHMNEDGCDMRSMFYYQDAPDGTAFSGYLTPIVSPSYLFGQVVALPNGSFVVSGERLNTSNPPFSYLEVADVRISRVAATGAFVCPTGWQGGPWTAVIPAGTLPGGAGGYPSLAAAADGRVGIAMTDFGQNVWLFESAHGTFAAGTVTARRLTNYSDATITQPDSTSTQWRPYINAHLAYNDTTPHVVWSELQARRSGTVFYADWRTRIMHWSPTTGVRVVKQGGPETGSYDNVDNGESGPVVGLNHISNDWPQVGFSADGSETYVVWVRFVDAEVDPTANAGIPGATGIGFGDIEASVSATGGGPWSPAQNLTQTPQTDERFVAIAPRNADGDVGILFQASATNQAGIAESQDRGTTPVLYVRRIAWLERPLAASVVGVDPPAAGTPAAGLTVYPNPARGVVRFVAGAGGTRDGAALVFGVDGRRLARLPLDRGRASWDGRDLSGQAVPSGIYLVRLEGEGSAAARFMWLRP